MPMLVLGIDEAGYGPNLGPLVIAASAWLIEDKAIQSRRAQALGYNASINTTVINTTVNSQTFAESMHEHLAPTFLPKPIRTSSSHIPLGDSKAIHQGTLSLESLEVGVGFWIQRFAKPISTFEETLKWLAPFSHHRIASIPWYQSEQKFDVQLACPQSNKKIGMKSSEVQELFERGTKLVDSLDIQFLGLSVEVIDEPEFNRRLEQYQNKSTLLSMASLQLAASVLKNLWQTYSVLSNQKIEIEIYCDKHGGRNRYLAPLLQLFPDGQFDVLKESAMRSDYASRYQDCPLRWTFLAKGDRLVATGLASMTAKWTREKLMQRLNHFWQSHLPGLAATAGYPQDAKRFAIEIQRKADELQLDRLRWWRRK